MLSCSESAATQETDAQKRSCAQALAPVFQAALVGAARGKYEEMFKGLSQKLISRDQHLLLWKLFFLNAPVLAVRELVRFNFIEEHKSLVAEILVSQASDVVKKEIDKWGIDEELRFEIAKCLAQKGELRDHLAKFDLKSETQLAELAVLQIKAGHNDYLEYQNMYSLQSPVEIFRVLKALAETGELLGPSYVPEQTVIYYQGLFDRVSVEQRGILAVAYAKSKAAIPNFNWMSHFADLPQDVKRQCYEEVMIKLINSAGWSFANTRYFPQQYFPYEQNIFNFNTQEIVLAGENIFKRLNADRVRERRRRDIIFFRYFGHNIASARKVAEKLRRIWFFKDVLGSIADSNGVPSLDSLDLVSDGENLDLSTAIEKYAHENPDLLSPELVRILLRDVRSREVLIGLLREFFRQPDEKLRIYPKESLELLCSISGLPYCDLKESALRDEATLFYELVIDIQSGLDRPAFESIPIEAAVLKNKQSFLTLLAALRDLLQIRGNGPDTWIYIQSQFGLSSYGITEGNFQKLIEDFRASFYTEIKILLQEHNLNFTADDFDKLEVAWGSLEPIWTLIARFHAKEDWKNELPLLIEVFKASVKDQFNDWKFRGLLEREETLKHSTVVEQLSSLDEAGKQEWENSRARVRLAEQQRPSEGLVLSVVSSHPKLLLTIGDLVQTPSSQNYLTGTHIETLLGYVGDANVQAMASFLIKPQDFENTADYNRVAQAVAENRLDKITFNGNLRIVDFALRETGSESVLTLSSRKLGSAYLRQIVKIGKVRGLTVAGIRLEREYFQDHPALTQMRKQHQELLKEMKTAVGAVDTGPVVISKSRNPNGVYSDAAEEMKTEEYLIP